MDRGDWWATSIGSQSWTRLKWLSAHHTHTHTHTHMFSSLSRGAALALAPGHVSPSAGDIFKASARPGISDSGTLA